MAVVIGPIIAFRGTLARPAATLSLFFRKRRGALSPLPVALAILGLCLAGCAGGYRWEGDWDGKRDYQAKPGQNDSVVYTLSKVHLSIHDGRYQLVSGGIPSSGQVQAENAGLSLLADTRLNQRVKPGSADGKLRSIDGRTIELTGAALDPAPVRLQRAPQRP